MALAPGVSAFRVYNRLRCKAVLVYLSGHRSYAMRDEHAIYHRPSAGLLHCLAMERPLQDHTLATCSHKRYFRCSFMLREGGGHHEKAPRVHTTSPYPGHKGAKQRMILWWESKHAWANAHLPELLELC